MGLTQAPKVAHLPRYGHDWPHNLTSISQAFSFSANVSCGREKLLENFQNRIEVLSTQSTHAYLVDNLFLLVQIVEFKEVEVLNQSNLRRSNITYSTLTTSSLKQARKSSEDTHFTEYARF